MYLNQLSDSYFYLSLENSDHCFDYVTEKFYFALNSTTVPVVFGYLFSFPVCFLCFAFVRHVYFLLTVFTSFNNIYFALGIARNWLGIVKFVLLLICLYRHYLETMLKDIVFKTFLFVFGRQYKRFTMRAVCQY
jgi:hypothetical protein